MKTCLHSKRPHTITKINDDKHEQYKAGSMNGMQVLLN
jgi:hypothetical protein